MKKNDLVNEFIDSKSKYLFAMVGPNNSGKTYFIKHSLFDNPQLESIIYLDEKGEYHVKGKRESVLIHNGFYYYNDEEKRGASEERNNKYEEITQESNSIINYLQPIKMKLNIPNKSLGTIKLYSIVDSLLCHNLNNIDYYIFDEPENALDDERMKNLQRIINVLINNKKKVFFVTHSPRFLELLQIEVDSIYLLPRHGEDIIHWDRDDIYNLYDETSQEIMTKIGNNNNIGKHLIIDFKQNTLLSRTQINIFLKDYDFYKVLFYSNVCIVEGDTEKYILKAINTLYGADKTIYPARGKFFSLFLSRLFTKYSIKVLCIIDSDYKNDKANNLPYLLSKVLIELQTTYNYKCVVLAQDLEHELNISINDVIENLTGESQSKSFCKDFMKSHKAIIAYYDISNDDKKKEKIIKIINDSNLYEQKYKDIFN